MDLLSIGECGSKIKECESGIWLKKTITLSMQYYNINVYITGKIYKLSPQKLIQFLENISQLPFDKEG